MNILFLNQEGHVAGSTLSLTYLAKGLAAKGHTIFVACRLNSLLSSLLADSDVNVIHLPMRFAFDVVAIRKIRDIVREHQIDIVNAQAGRDRYNSMYARFFYNLPAAFVHTRRQMPSSSGGRLKSWLYYYGTDAIIAVSHAVKQGLVKKGLPADHIHVIYNGTPREKYASLDSSRIHELAALYNINPDTHVVGCVARVSKRKHHAQLLQALKYVNSPVTLLFVGASKRPELVALANEIADKHTVHFCGTIPPVDSLHHMALFDVFVLPSTMEGLSQSILEAMALGIPVLATRAGGNIDLVRDDINGFLFDHNDVHGLAKRIEQLLSNASLRTALAERAKQTALREFSIELTIDFHEQFFQSLLSKRQDHQADILPA